MGRRIPGQGGLDPSIRLRQVLGSVAGAGLLTVGVALAVSALLAIPLGARPVPEPMVVGLVVVLVLLFAGAAGILVFLLAPLPQAWGRSLERTPRSRSR